MIVQLTGSLIEVTPSVLVLDVNGVGYELRCSAMTAASVPAVGTSGVTLLTRLAVRENSMTLFGFASREERTLFDRLIAVSGVGPSLALSVLSTFTPAACAAIVATNDATRMATVPGVGKKTATRLLVELQSVFASDVELRGLVTSAGVTDDVATPSLTGSSLESDVQAALLSMGFTPQEVELALDGYEQAGAATVEQIVAYALRRLGGKA
ncbi:MAG: Holliday junction branch migration protein RuvA [Atopobium sp.]|uniref:Holliday junction branch migration protein RuvA n=1 Tax=Atopobium sp. TaxID=1872650 RepID=UPI002A833399|nr:Holliday junction branch migration protein RuvA [Atopobium sp.]MDY4522328.1 Holliday junction branch migration protein RuvA [Atopobium sp.]